MQIESEEFPSWEAQVLAGDCVAVTTTTKEKTTPKLSPSFHLIGQQPTLTTSFSTLKIFHQQIIPAYLLLYHLYQQSPSSQPSDV